MIELIFFGEDAKESKKKKTRIMESHNVGEPLPKTAKRNISYRNDAPPPLRMKRIKWKGKRENVQRHKHSISYLKSEYNKHGVLHLWRKTS